MTIATLTLTSTSLDNIQSSFTFDTFPTIDGYASVQDWHEEEELTSPGIDGRRWRTIFNQFPPIIVGEDAPAWSSAATHGLACNLADVMKKSKGRFGQLMVTSGGTRTVKLLVHVTAVHARVNPGSIVGPGVSGAASVASSWVLDVLEAQ